MDLEKLPGGLMGPRLEAVVAVGENDVIGRANRLPWHLGSDLKRFKALTLGKPILMGRKTYASIGKALPGRLNLVLTRAADFTAPGCTRVASVDAALAAAAGHAVLMVIGGAEVYRECLSRTDCIHLTLVHARIDDGDTFFPQWRSPEWHESYRETHPPDDKNDHPYTFLTLDRRS